MNSVIYFFYEWFLSSFNHHHSWHEDKKKPPTLSEQKSSFLVGGGERDAVCTSLTHPTQSLGVNLSTLENNRPHSRAFLLRTRQAPVFHSTLIKDTNALLSILHAASETIIFTALQQFWRETFLHYVTFCTNMWIAKISAFVSFHVLILYSTFPGVMEQIKSVNGSSDHKQAKFKSDLKK